MQTISVLRLHSGVSDVMAASHSAVVVRAGKKRRVRCFLVADQEPEQDERVEQGDDEGRDGQGGSNAEYDGHQDDMCENDGSKRVVQNRGDPGAAGSGNGAPAEAVPAAAPRPHPRRYRNATVQQRAITLEQRKARVNSDRRSAVRSNVYTCLRGGVGLMTAAADFTRGGLCGRLVRALHRGSHALFCRVGPALVDNTSLWLSRYRKVLCSCREHTQNMALALSTGRGSTCWHSQSFRAGNLKLPSVHADIAAALKIKAYVEPNSFTFDM